MSNKKHYDEIASDYEKLSLSNKVNSQLTKKCKEIFVKHEIATGSILDVGSGPGNLKTELGDGFEYTAIDYSEKMLELAGQKGYSVILGSLEEELSKLSDKSFDYVVSLGTLLFVKDIQKALSEFSRIARKGWLVGLDDITDSYIKNYTGDDPIYNHSKVVIDNAIEDVYFEGWTSPTTGDVIYTRMVFVKL